MAVQFGDLGFVGFNADGDDGFAIVALQDIAAGETVLFTDNEWDGQDFNSGEGLLSWTTTEAVAAGTVVTFEAVNGANPVASIGTVSGTAMELDGQSEMVWAFTGTIAAPVEFLGVIANTYGSNYRHSPELANTGLTDEAGAIIINGNDDVLEYSGPTAGSAAALLAAISDEANWLTDNGGGDQSADDDGADFPSSGLTFQPAGPAMVLNESQGTQFECLQEGFTSAQIGDSFNLSGEDYCGKTLVVTRVDGLRLAMDDTLDTPPMILVVATGANSFHHSGNASMHVRLTNASATRESVGSKSVVLGDGDDVVRAHKGDNDITLGGGNDLAYGGQHDDTIDGGAGDDFLHGQQDNDTLNGGEGMDRLFGDNGDDIVNGGAGADTVVGGAGADVLDGGAGDDRIYVGKVNGNGDGDADIILSDVVSSGRDRIWGFDDDVDQIQISGVSDMSELLMIDDVANDRVILARAVDGAPSVDSPWLMAVYGMTAATIADDIVLV